MTQPGEFTYVQQPPRNITYEQYLAEVSIVVAALFRVIAGIAIPYQALKLSRRDWINFLAQTYPQVDAARRRVSSLSREFYDSERYKATGSVVMPELDNITIEVPDGPDLVLRNDRFTEHVQQLNILLASYEPSWFEEAMEPERAEFSEPNAPDKSLAKVLSRAQKETENAGRNTVMRAVDSASPKVVRGWARVEGTENIGSCGFCAMLISRGPVYTDSPEYAGLNVDSNTRAVRIFEKAASTGDDSELMSLMNRWHPNCDCKVVPVFKGATESWPGYEQYKALEALWGETTGEYTGRDKLNAFRRRLQRGDLPADIRRPRAA